MAFIDVVEWSPKPDDIKTDNDINGINRVYAWQFPNSNLSTATQLIVRESQEAVFFSKGQMIGKFGPGRHTLTTENLPLLRKMYGIPFGGTNPFFAEVWFVNKTMPLNIAWKTSPMKIMDPDFGAVVPIVAQGQYGVQVSDAEMFLVKLIGTMPKFTADNLTSHFMGPLIAKTNSAIASFMMSNRVGISQISTQLDQLSTFLSTPMAEFWGEYGLRLTGFYITSIDVDDSDEGRMISKAISERSRQSIEGYTWQQRQSFNVANTAAGKGGNMGILEMAMMTGMMTGANSFGQSMMQPPNQGAYGQGTGFDGYRGGSGQTGAGFGQQPQPMAQPRSQVYCANCGRPHSTDSRFCPNCGHEYHPCPVCGADNMPGARRCVTCGAQLVQPSAAFSGNACPRCHTSAPLGTKFCPQCGNRLL